MKATKKQATEEWITEVVAESLVSEEDLERYWNKQCRNWLTSWSGWESGIESGVDQIVAKDKQSETYSRKEAFLESDAVEPGPVVTESDIASRRWRFLFSISHFFC